MFWYKFYRSEPKTMTTSSEESQDWTENVASWIEAHWRWLILAVLLVFALNNFAGFVVGIMGIIAFANRVAGRVLKARKVVQQVQGMVTNPDEQREVE